MPDEIEAKLRIPNHDEIRQKLKSLGATGGPPPANVTHETNTFFDTPDRTLVTKGEGLRLRENKRPDGTTYVVTYKGPKKQGPFKSREEVEFTIDDPEAFKRTLEALGYQQTLSFPKTRETYHLANCTIELDTLPTLPPPNTFLEVEGPNNAAIQEVLDDLGLADEPLEKASYSKLIAQANDEK